MSAPLVLWATAAGSLALVFRRTWPDAVGYLPALAPLLAALLGIGYVAWYDRLDQRGRIALGVWLGAVVLAGPLTAKPASLPLAVTPATLAARELGRAVRATQEAIPADQPVVVIGGREAVFLAGRRAPARQSFGLWTLDPTMPREQRTRNGAWGADEVREWLAAGPAVVVAPREWAAHGRICPDCLAAVLQHVRDRPPVLINSYDPRTALIVYR